MSVRYFNDSPFPFLWFIPIFTTILMLCFFASELNKRNKPFKFPMEWFTGKNWYMIEGWQRFEGKDKLKNNIDYRFIFNHNSFQETSGSLDDDGNLILLDISFLKQNVPAEEQISHFRLNKYIFH